ncbi:MAG: iron-containing alcohol dehydrogenase [Clostridiales bacterium]|jgi:ActR/RegA family two-component response regulator|nr:iron-containing alcohol dehydrogenase [Clostridiales bacterium]
MDRHLTSLSDPFAMAAKAVKLGELQYAFKPLKEEAVINIFKMCMVD